MGLIDVHHHFAPSGKDNEGRGWTVAGSLDEMDRNGVDAAIGSLPPVGDGGPSRARAWNEWGARLCADHPGRLGLFATLPLSAMDDALGALAYAIDVLRADGVGLPTSYGDVWLSDERFEPLLAEMDRRRVVVFVHPYATSQCRAVGTAYGGDLVTPPWLEFPTNTARLILGLLVRGVNRRYPGIRWIFAHGGGTMPVLLGRIAGFDGWDSVGPDTLARVFPGGIHAGFADFYVECAQAYAPEAFALLQRLLPASHLLFGSDYTYFPVAHSVRALDALKLGDSALASGNALSLFPRFAGVSS